jgi:hypothetical protein
MMNACSAEHWPKRKCSVGELARTRSFGREGQVCGVDKGADIEFELTR